jgi:Cep192 domain 4
MRKFIRRAVVGAGAVVTVLGAAAGVASASPSPAALAFTPAPYDYGQVTNGQTASQTLTLANSGGKASGALTVTVAGSAQFTITADTCTGISLAKGKSCTVMVQFAPTTAGTASATLTAANKKDVLAADTLTGTGVAVPAAHLYWANFAYGVPSAGTISEANLDGSNPQTIVSGQTGPQGVAVDSSHLYWVNTNEGTINEAPLTGGTATTLVTGQDFPDRAGGGQQPPLLG